MKERFFEIWNNKEDYEDPEGQMIRILESWLDQHYSYINHTDEQIAALKRDFESDLPHRVVMEAVGCDLEMCQRIRWRGEDMGVVDRHGKNEKTIPPGRRRKVYERDDDQCVRCASTGELECHHIIPQSHGGQNLVDNLAILCKPCHKEAHCGDYKSRRTAYDGKNEFWNAFVEDG